MDLVGGKWKAVILYHLKDAHKRYTELRKELPGVTERTLSLQLKQLEEESAKKNCTEIFIETPYRNNKMLENILLNCKPSTQLCIAAELTSANEWVKAKTIAEWKNEKIDLHKKPAIFLLMA